jgi:hypothetical protein
MWRILTVLQLCCCSSCWVLGSIAPLRGQEPAEAELKKLAEASQARAKSIEVKVADGDRFTRATVHPDPLMKYTDVPRRIELATLWVWQDEGRPIALGKVEAYGRKEGTKWLYCFASAATGLVDARWPNGRVFKADKIGVEWAAVKGPMSQETAAGRLRQMKELFGRFTATARDDLLKTTDELRPLTRPLHEYSSAKHGVLQGILCGFAANGTNPDVIVALELVSAGSDTETSKSWRYAVIPMTASGVSVKLDKTEVFARPYAKSPKDFETWTYFWEDAPKK